MRQFWDQTPGPGTGADRRGLETNDEREGENCELTFASTADVTEARRQVPIHPDDWHLLGRQLISGGEVFINTVAPFGP